MNLSRQGGDKFACLYYGRKSRHVLLTSHMPSFTLHTVRACKDAGGIWEIDHDQCVNVYIRLAESKVDMSQEFIHDSRS